MNSEQQLDAEDASDTDTDVQELEEFLDWRSKTAWKWLLTLGYPHYLALAFKNLQYCQVLFVGMPFCLLVQNFPEIRQSVYELWLKKRFSR